MLGHKLCQIIPTRGHSVAATVRNDRRWKQRSPMVYDRVDLISGVDVLNAPRLTTVLHETAPRWIINCVGIIKQRPEAENRHVSVGVNAFLPHMLAAWCEEHHARLIHISTDCVFSGRDGNYTEESPSDAIDIYGKSKFLGETDDCEPAAITLRTSIIGRELIGPTHGLIEWFLSQSGQRVRGFRKAIFSGLTTQELARVILGLIERSEPLAGLYQVAAQPINKYDLLLKFQERFQTDAVIAPHDDFVCDRSLNPKRFHSKTGYVAPSWDELLAEVADDPTPYASWRDAEREAAEYSPHHSVRSC
jgi:dTDP-4-dehydrorhamnose reductase